jgi:hypothetical protein
MGLRARQAGDSIRWMRSRALARPSCPIPGPSSTRNAGKSSILRTACVELTRLRFLG